MQQYSHRICYVKLVVGCSILEKESNLFPFCFLSKISQCNILSYDFSLPKFSKFEQFLRLCKLGCGVVIFIHNIATKHKCFTIFRKREVNERIAKRKIFFYHVFNTEFYFLLSSAQEYSLI